ncbi:hypothetical protein McanCB56680_003953 [Microsporum canis]
MDQKLRSDASSNPAWVTVVEEHADHGITVEPHGVERGDRRFPYATNYPQEPLYLQQQQQLMHQIFFRLDGTALHLQLRHGETT